MNETGYKCPKCGQEDMFTADRVLLMTEMLITKDGWDYLYGETWNADLPPDTMITCCECEYTGDWTEFDNWDR